MSGQVEGGDQFDGGGEESPAGPAESLAQIIRKHEMPADFAAWLNETGVVRAISESIVSLWCTPKPIVETFNHFCGLIGAEVPVDLVKVTEENAVLRDKLVVLNKQLADLEGRKK